MKYTSKIQKIHNTVSNFNIKSNNYYFYIIYKICEITIATISILFTDLLTIIDSLNE